MKFHRRSRPEPQHVAVAPLVEVELLADQVLDVAQKMREAVALLRSQDTITANPDSGE